MKKSVYYMLLVVLWIAIVLVLALLLLATGLFAIPGCYGFAAQLGGACGHPQLWVIAIGIVLLLRPFVIN